MLVVRNAVVGPFASNCALAACTRTGEAALLDPGGEVGRALGLRAPEGFRGPPLFGSPGIQQDPRCGLRAAGEGRGDPLDDREPPVP